MQVLTRNMVQAAEVWIPEESGSHLYWLCGDYGDHRRLAAASRHGVFPAGKGLIGEVWRTGSPRIMHDLPESSFAEGHEREELLREAGLTCGMAIPVLKNGRCAAVFTLLCDRGDFSQGAFEIWGRNERDELGLVDGYYANLDRFGRVSQYVKFPRRAGLPGSTWVDRRPKLLEKVGRSKNFMRAAGARADGLNVGLSIPLMPDVRGLEAILVLLSSEKTPIARVFEVWKPSEVICNPDDARTGDAPIEPPPRTLTIEQASYGTLADLAAAGRELSYLAGQGIAGKVFQTGLPWASDDAIDLEGPRSGLLAQHELTSGWGFPVFDGDDLTAVVVMFL